MDDSSKYIWVPHESLGWLPAKLALAADRKPNGYFIVQNGNVSDQLIKANELQISQFPVANQSSFTRIFPNLVNLEEFSEGAILHQIRERYNSGDIYTNVGSILIAVNPFKTLSIYTSSVLKEYHTRNPNAQTQKAPHVYSVISGAYWSMGEEGKDQSVLISGESGSGKTETTKIVLQFLSEVAGSETSVEQQVMSSNPILEAFGNAKTLRNNNSSRFGKWMEIKFNDQRIMCGARINNYLLEKSRVVKQAQGERNYHYFYQLCSGVSEQLRSKFSIWKADKFNYLNQSGSLSIEGVNDAFEFAEVLTSFQKLDFKESEIEAIIGSVAAVLHLGNLILESKVVNGTEQSYVSNRDQIALVGRVLQIDPDLLEESICFRTMFMKTETQKIYLRVDQALDSRDSLAKAIYGNLFDWLVSKINNFLGVNLKGHMRMIGVLDIFGFEVFEKNSFEQLCINFANETLQLYFNDFIFKMEQDEYKTECVSVERVGFVDNIETTELISSMLQMIDEEILLPKGSDSTFLEKANSQYASSKTKPAHPSYVIHKTSTNNFSIKHYAGGVIYTTDNFLEKSKDSIHDSLLSCIRKSSNSLIQMLFADNTLDTKELGASGPINLNGTLSASQSRSKLGSMLKKKSQTLGSKFKQQLDVLMENIKNTSPHFIRCVKPNSAKKPNIFESNLVLQQLRYAGLFEAVRIRAAGYSFRRPFLSFANRYAVLTSKEDRKKFLNIKVDPKDEFASSAAARQKVDLVLSSTKLENDPNICLGKSKVFYRSEVMKNLEKLRDNQYLKSAIRLQSVIRSSLARWTLKKLRKIRVESLKAIKEGDLNSLQSIVKFAEESKLYSKIQNEILKDLEYLVEEGKIVTLLENAIQISDINQLEAGIQQAEKLMLPEKTKSSKTKKVIGDAIQLKESILKLKDFKNKLNIAVQSSNISDIKQLLDILGKFDSKKLADFKELIHTAQSIVSDFEAQQKPFDNLQSFMQGIKDRLFEVNEIRNVMGLISDCEKISKMNPIRVEQVTQARTLMLKSARAPLERAIIESDPASITKEIGVIEELGLKSLLSRELQDARNVLKTIEESKNRALDEEIMKKKRLEMAEMAKENERKQEEEDERRLQDVREKEQKIAKLQHDLEGAMESRDASRIHQILDKEIMVDDDVRSRLANIASNFARSIDSEKEKLEKLATAMGEFDRVEMKRLLAEIDIASVSKIKEVESLVVDAQRICYILSEKEFLCLQLQSAFQKQDEAKCEFLIDQANQCGIDDEQVRAVTLWLSQQKLKSQKVEGSANLNFSVFADASQEKALQDYFWNLRGSYPLRFHPLIRDPNDFSKNQLFAKGKIKKYMLQWQDEPISTSLLKLNDLTNEIKANKSTAKNEGKEVFKNVQAYMRDRYHPYPNTMAEELLFKGLQDSWIRDEIYAQLIKQTTENPHPRSEVLGWKLIYMCLITFAPVMEETRRALLCHIVELSTTSLSKFVGLDTTENIALNCFKALQEILRGSNPETPLSLASINDMTEDTLPIITVKGLDSEPLCVPVTSQDMKIEELCTTALSDKGVSSSVNATLYLCLEEKKGNALEKKRMACKSHEPIMSVYSHWELLTRMNDQIKYSFELSVSGKGLSPTNPSVIAQRHSTMLRNLPRESLVNLKLQSSREAKDPPSDEQKPKAQIDQEPQERAQIQALTPEPEPQTLKEEEESNNNNKNINPSTIPEEQE